MSLSFDTSHCASRGARQYQEDACVFALLPADGSDEATTSAQADAIVAVLADGMGGHVGGERASTTACRGFVDALATRAESGEGLLGALASANEAIRRETASEPGLLGMGCTLIGAVFGVHGLRWVSVGDSRLLLFRRGELYQLNEDHSLAPLLDQLAADGEMTREQALAHPRRHHLRSALTGETIELIDHANEAVALEAGDCIILASDGIDTLEPDRIADVIEQSRAAGAEAIASALIATVDAIGHPTQDNTTVMAIIAGV